MKNMSKADRAEVQARLKLSAGNVFSHFNSKFSQLEHKRAQCYSSLDKMGLYCPRKEFRCRQITFFEFVKLAFDDDVPQFIQTLFNHLSSLDLRELLKPYLKNNSIRVKLEERVIQRQDKKRTNLDGAPPKQDFEMKLMLMWID